MNLTFEQLPEAVANLTREVRALKLLLTSKEQQAEQPEQFFTIQQAADFLCLSVPTIYSKVSKRELPVMKKGKRLYFAKSELIEYLKAGKKMTSTEIESEIHTYLSNNQKK